ncbi:MAG: hypothetical protein ACLVL7_10690 [Anaerotruncus massiliensis (ex Togo et al. 2019)]
MPADTSHGDFASNIAGCARPFKARPANRRGDLPALDLRHPFDRTEIAGPGHQLL